MSGFGSKLKEKGKEKKKSNASSSFAEKFRKGFGGGKDRKQGKLRTKTTFQKIFGD